MQLRFSLDAAAPQAQVALLVRNAEEVKPLLRRWAGYLRKKARERAQGATSPPLAESTVKKYLQARGPLITRMGTVRQAQARRIAQALAARRDKNSRAELERLVALAPEVSSGQAGARDRAAAPAGQTYHKSVERVRKAILAKRSKRRKRGKDPGGRHLLGKLVTAWKAYVNPRSAAVQNMVDWSAIHNEGGTAGNGAPIPARLGLAIEREDVDELVKIVLDHLTQGT